MHCENKMPFAKIQTFDKKTNKVDGSDNLAENKVFIKILTFAPTAV